MDNKSIEKRRSFGRITVSKWTSKQASLIPGSRWYGAWSFRITARTVDRLFLGGLESRIASVDSLKERLLSRHSISVFSCG